MNSDFNNNLSAYFSQSTESLYHFLTQNLFAGEKSPLLKRIVLVPSPLMKNWLVKSMADDLGISMGIEILLQEHGIRKIADYAGIKTPTLVPNVEQLAFAFQQLIPKLSAEYPFLKNYLDSGHQKRLLSLAAEMAELFLDYGTFGGDLLDDWKQTPPKHWQAALWQMLSREYPQWGMPRQLFQKTEILSHKTFEIHLFAVSFLPAVVIRFLESLSIPVYFYHLSPTQTFWEDTLSGSQRRYLCKVWEEKGTSANQLQDLNKYLKETHPLLANWGKLGRMMVKQLPGDLVNYEELYPLPAQVFDSPEWSDYIYPETTPIDNCPLTLLSRLQADLVTMRPIPEATTASEWDGTIQIHQTVCKRREVEEIYNIIVGILEKHSNDSSPIAPEDVVVMAPDIIEYAPFIQAHFERAESILDYRLMDIALPTHDPCIRAFSMLLSLIGSRWESSTLKDLLHLELFQKKMEIDAEGVLKIQKWIEENEVVWGMDKAHHAESLVQGHCPKGIEVHQGTWEHFFERTLRGLITIHEESISINESDILPYSQMDINDAELLGKWIEALRKLYRDLKSIEQRKATLLEWSVLLENLCNDNLYKISEQLEKIFHQLRQTAIPFPTEQYTYDAVNNWFEDAFQKGKTSYREQHIHSIRFCSLLPMRAIPAKVVILCGMSEDAFPRIQLETSQNLMKECKTADPKPKKVDFDRYLMLETILSARQYLVFTYSSPNQHQGPSLIINELVDLLDRYYSVNGKTASEALFFKHPFRRYDPYYFEGNEHKSYSMTAFHEAVAFSSTEKKSIARFIEQFSILEDDTPLEPTIIPLSELENLAKDPLSFYYKKTLGISLKEEAVEKTERTLTLSSLQAAMIPRNALKGNLENEILLFRKRGELPEGIFEDIAKRTIQTKSKTLEDNLRKVGANPKDLFDYSFESIPFHPENMPQILISGTIENITSEGLVLHCEGKREHEYRFLPRVLLFHYLVKEGLINAKAKVIYSESAKTFDLLHPNPKHQIEIYLQYWKIAKQNPSPLAPKWIDSLLSNDADKLESVLNDTFRTIYSAYEKENTQFDFEHLMKSPWVEWSRRLYDPIV